MITLFSLLRQLNFCRCPIRIYYNKCMMRRLWLFLLLAGVCSAALPGQATTFTAKNDAFTLDMPAGWKAAAKVAPDSVLTLEKGTARLEIKTIDCPNETCLETKINADLADIKRKKMKVVGNSYTGEDIKRIEFSTGEPFFYINFYTPKNDFAAGYFLIGPQSYSILAKNLTYAQTDLIFSFISPRTVEKVPGEEIQPLEMDVQDPRAYDIAAVPNIAEETVSAPTEATKPAPAPRPSFSRYVTSAKKKLTTAHINTFISQRMPPYVRHWGRGFDVLILLGLAYVGLQAVALFLRLLIRPKRTPLAANPNSLYPIRFTRLYGTPSLIFRAKDNQGNILISLSSRWDSLFLFAGLLLVLLTCALLAITGICERGQLLPFSAFTYDTIYSFCSLLIPLGLVIFFCGVVWAQLVLREISLFDRKGKKAAIVLQKGFGLIQEKYEIYFARSKEVLVAKRRRFTLRRHWQLFGPEANLLADITETSRWRALVRKVCGHLWGFLRADYHITGQMESTGTITSDRSIFNRFTCELDKPQAINARDLLVLSLLINIRDKDKWYPWFN